MFAGPNGSGKSTLASFVAPQLLGVSVNADDIEAQVRRDGSFDTASMGVATPADALLAELIGAPILTAEHRRQISGLAQAHDGRIFFPFAIDSYVGSAIAEVVRSHLVKEGISFTFETVMSHPSKVEFLREAQRHGYRTYLYFIATGNPQINVARVRARVQRGGHDVPEDRVIARYWRSLGLLSQAVAHADRSYVFDNSGDSPVFFAEGTNGGAPIPIADVVPDWFTQAIAPLTPNG